MTSAERLILENQIVTMQSLGFILPSVEGPTFKHLVEQIEKTYDALREEKQ